VKRFSILAIILLICLVIFPLTHVHAQTAPPVVHAVLYYSPTCGHCEYVITGILLPMMEDYGDQLQIIGIDVTQEEGQQIFLAAIQKFQLERAGVPFLVIDNTYLMGDVDIPERFPIMVETYLTRGGVDWPDIQGLDEYLKQPENQNQNTPVPNAGPSQESFSTAAADAFTAVAITQTAALQPTAEPVTVFPSSPTSTAALGIIGISTDTPHWRTIFSRDPAGNTLSVIVLIAMLGAFAWTIISFKNVGWMSFRKEWLRLIPLLCLIGFGVAGYLTYVETTNTTAVCGPVGDCNTVQQSEYARMFGVLPIGMLGLLGYVAIFITWLLARYARRRISDFGTLALFVMAALGTLFSIYLTFLEPFVIGATCAWCLTSAIVMTMLMLGSISPARNAFDRLDSERKGVAET
jgi:uncharacterized membrane protein